MEKIALEIKDSELLLSEKPLKFGENKEEIINKLSNSVTDTDIYLRTENVSFFGYLFCCLLFLKHERLKKIILKPTYLEFFGVERPHEKDWKPAFDETITGLLRELFATFGNPIINSKEKYKYKYLKDYRFFNEKYCIDISVSQDEDDFVIVITDKENN